eukprot:gene16573-18903_t
MSIQWFSADVDEVSTNANVSTGIVLCLYVLSYRVESQSDDFLGAFIPEESNVERQIRKKEEAIRRAENKLREEANVPMNQEMIAIEAGRADYLKALAHRKSLLCVSFVSTDSTTLSLLSQNMAIMEGHCDWAVVFYEGSAADVSTFCSKVSESLLSSSQQSHRKQNTLVQCKQAADTANRQEIHFPFLNGQLAQERVTVPKSILYHELVPYLPYYHKVFVMDEDTSLEGFNIQRFLQIWQCSFNNDFRPLIVQPLLAERTQTVPYVHADTWARAKGRVFSSSVGLVEQQVPFFDATFLEWFIRHVLVHTREVALAQGVDQSLDRTWCRAASFYAAQVMHQNYTKRGDACAVIVGGPNTTAVHHLNTRALQNKRVNRDLYRQKAQVVNEHYKFLFPTWVQSDIGRPVNPLDRILGKKYRKYLTLNTRCLQQYALDQM